MKVLSIGNSFSQDAQRYLHQIAAKEGVELFCEDLVIGGCWLAKHCDNIRNRSSDYEVERNGESTGLHSSIPDALKRECWDAVTIQQVSSEAFRRESYVPYVRELADCIRQHAPQAKIFLHQTWAYEQGSDKLRSVHFEDSREMLAQIQQTCHWAARQIHADGVIPSGEAMMAALDAGLPKVHRDGYHAELGAGRYLLGCVWYMTLTGNEMTGGAIALDAEASPRDMETARTAALKTVRNAAKGEEQ